MSEAVKDPWRESEPELSARLLRPMLRFYETSWGRSALEEFAAGLGTSLEVLEDQDLWFSAECFMAFNRAMVEQTGDPEITYKAGRAVVEAGPGMERLFARALLSPRHVYRLSASIAARHSRITTWDADIAERNRARIVFRTDSPTNDDHLFCRNRVGVLEAAPLLFGLLPAIVDHPICLHRGGDRCEYHVRWTNSIPWTRPTLAVFASALVTTLGLWVVGSPWTLTAALITVGLGVLGAGMVAGNARRIVREASHLATEQVHEIGQAMEETKQRVERLGLLQVINEVAARHLDEDRLLDAVLDKLAQGSAWDRVLLLLVDEDAGVLAGSRHRGFGEAASFVDDFSVQLHQERIDERLFANIVRGGVPVLIEDMADYARELTPRNSRLVTRFGSASMIAVPMEARGEVLGLLIVDRLADRLDVRDKAQLRSVAAAIGMALSNARLFAQVRAELLKNRKYSQFLPSPVVRQIQDDPEAALRLGGKRRAMALMFCDIAGFTALSAECEPEDVVRGLNAWFGIADPVIESCNGIVDKRMGDGILVVFLKEESSLGGRHPVERAAAAAVGMHEALESARDELETLVPVFAGITVRWAIHWGEVIAGNLGSQARVEYTVIGDVVNTCARLEEITPAGAAWMTGDAVRAVPGGGFSGAQFEVETTLRGRREQTDVWSIPLERDWGATKSGTWARLTSSIALSTLDLGPVPEDEDEDVQTR